MNYNYLEGGILIIVLIVLLVAILLYVFYLLNLQRLLNEVSPENRLVPPTNVWLMFIPLFNLVYPFILYPKICDSVKKEYQVRGLSGEGDFGKGMGITLGVLGLVGMLRFMPTLVLISSFASLVVLILFWVKMSGYKNQLMAMPKADGGISSNPDLLD